METNTVSDTNEMLIQRYMLCFLIHEAQKSGFFFFALNEEHFERLILNELLVSGVNTVFHWWLRRGTERIRVSMFEASEDERTPCCVQRRDEGNLDVKGGS